MSELKILENSTFRSDTSNVKKTFEYSVLVGHRKTLSKFYDSSKNVKWKRMGILNRTTHPYSV